MYLVNNWRAQCARFDNIFIKVVKMFFFVNLVTQVGDLRRLFLQDQHIQLRPTEIRYAYVVFK